MSYRIKRRPLPGHKALVRAVSENLDAFGEGARLVDDDARGASGVDVVVADGEGRPVLVDVVVGVERELPTRLHEHRAWLESSGRLFMKAYGREGVSRLEEPGFVFVVGEMPAAVSSALASSMDGPVRVLRAEAFTIDGEDVVSFEDVSPEIDELSTDAEERVSADSEEDVVPRSSDAAIALFDLFESGVDGLDGRIEQSEDEEGVVFSLSGRRLARVTWSPESFTVTVGEGRSNPIVVSDRVSLERALNAVVSYFVREEEPARAGDAASISEDERAELAAVWSGASRSE
jgi:hypothetical protein